MDIEELNAMIPSETVRQYVLDTGWMFTDMQRAALLYHSGLPLEQQCSWLRTVLEKTKDECLREQITEYLSLKEQGFQAFKENEDRRHIYVLRIKDENEGQYYQIQPQGYFFRWDAAYARGKRSSYPFQIEKCVIYDEEGASDDNDSPVAALDFSADGKVAYLWSREVPFDAERDGSFTYAFYEVPNPFERGDVVRLAGKTADYGIIETSQQHWREALDRYKNPKKFPPDYSDVQIRVGFLNEDGTFSHAHINPIALERYHPDDSPMDKLLLCASDLYKGKGSLDELYYFTMEYRQFKEKC